AGDAPHAAALHAWSDLALGEAALVLGQLRVALHRFEAVALPAAGPTALRMDAMRQLIGLAVERRDLESARTWQGKAIALGEAADRPIQTARLRLYTLLVSYAVGDAEGMRDAIAALAALDTIEARLGRLLLATSEDDSIAIPAVIAVMEEARASGETLLQALCLVIQVRRHLAAGRAEDAAALI